MKIEWAMLCRDFVETEDGVDILGAGVDNFDVYEDLPVKLPLTVAYRMVLELDEFPSVGHKMTARVFGPEMQPLAQATFPVNIPGPGPRHPVNKEGRVLESLFVPLPAITEGEYVIEIQMDQGTPITLGCSVHRRRREA